MQLSDLTELKAGFSLMRAVCSSVIAHELGDYQCFAPRKPGLFPVIGVYNHGNMEYAPSRESKWRLSWAGGVIKFDDGSLLRASGRLGFLILKDNGVHREQTSVPVQQERNNAVFDDSASAVVSEEFGMQLNGTDSVYKDRAGVRCTSRWIEAAVLDQPAHMRAASSERRRSCLA